MSTSMISATSFGSDQGAVLGARLRNEENLPANSFRFGGDGLEIGIVIDTRHPDVGAPALVMSDRTWVLRDKLPGMGALYHSIGDGYGLMRRVEYRIVNPQEGKPFGVFSNPKTDSVLARKCVHVTTALRQGVKPKIPLFDLIEGKILKRGGDEALMELSPESPVITVYRPDGSVVDLIDEGDTPAVSHRSYDDAFNARLKYLQQRLNAAREMQDEAKHRLIDWTTGEVLRMLNALKGHEQKQETLVEWLIDLDRVRVLGEKQYRDLVGMHLRLAPRPQFLIRLRHLECGLEDARDIGDEKKRITTEDAVLHQMVQLIETHGGYDDLQAMVVDIMVDLDLRKGVLMHLGEALKTCATTVKYRFGGSTGSIESVVPQEERQKAQAERAARLKAKADRRARDRAAYDATQKRERPGERTDKNGGGKKKDKNGNGKK